MRVVTEPGSLPATWNDTITSAYVKALLQLLDHSIAGVLDNARLAELSKALCDLGYSGDAKLDHAVHQLHHYVSDADIRLREPEYGAVERDRPRKIADEIREAYGELIN